jgi:VWFA-related protein
MWTRAATLCVVLILAGRADAQQSAPPEQPTFRAEVSVVEVVAVVTGEDDRSLTDLTAADFALTEDGEPRDLLSVRRLSSSSSATAAAARRPPTNVEGAYVERLATNADVTDAPAFVLLLDDLDTSPWDNHRMIRAAEGALAAIPATALVAVVTTSGADGTLMTLARPGPEHVAAIRAFRGRLLLRAGGLPPGGTPGSAVNAPCGVGSHALQSLDCADPTRPARRAAAVGAVAEILGRAGARRKVLLWLAVTMGVSPLDPEGGRAAQRKALQSALNSDVAVYILDPRENTGGEERGQDKRTGGTMRIGTGTTAFGGGAGGVLTLDVDDMVAVPLTQITRETGGRYITMANDLDVMLAHIVEQNTTAYVLTYESPVSREPGQHRIDVRVRRPGARVYARRGYFVEPPATDATREVALAPQARLLRDTLLGSVSQGALPLAVHVAPRFADGRQGSATVTIHLEDESAHGDAIDLLVATVDEQGRIANQRQVRMAPPPAGAPWEVTTDLELPRGRHQLRVAAATADASRTGLVLTPVEIIEPARDLVMTPPVVLDTTDGRVHPTAIRRFPVGEPVGVQVEVGGRPVQQRTVTVRTSLVDASGNNVRSADAMLDPGVKADRQRATAVLSTDGLGAGTYALLVEATEGEETRVVRHAVPIELVGAPPAVTTAGVAIVPHSVVARGPTSMHDTPGTFVIRTEQEWHTFWRQLPTRQAPPDIDFARVTLLAVVGEAGTADPSVDTVTHADGTTVVRWRVTPAPEVQDASAAGRRPLPFVVVGLVEHQATDIRFERATAALP